MNIEQAKAIAITTVLEKLNHRPVKQNEKEAWYLSLFREEKTASFHVNLSDNIWYDFGEGKGGNILDFVCAYLRSTGEDGNIPDALRWLGNMVAAPVITAPKRTAKKTSGGWRIVRAGPLEDLALIRYLQQRGIPLAIAKKYLSEVHVKHSVKNTGIYALGFKNEDGGYELRNPFFKSSVSPKTITFVRGSREKQKQVHIFEGFMDYPSFLAFNNKDQVIDDVIVLNSTNCVLHALPFIKKFGYQTVFTWLHNDVAGDKATQVFKDFCEAETGLTHQPLNKIYLPHNDVNAWHMYQLNLSCRWQNV